MNMLHQSSKGVSKYIRSYALTKSFVTFFKGVSLNVKSYPNAWTYLSNVSRDGVCRTVLHDSKREIALLVVCKRVAKSSWVTCAFSRTSRSAIANSISRLLRSYKDLASGSDMISFSSASLNTLERALAFSKEKLAMIFYLFQTFSCQFQFAIGCFLRFFDKTVQNHN